MQLNILLVPCLASSFCLRGYMYTQLIKNRILVKITKFKQTFSHFLRICMARDARHLLMSRCQGSMCRCNLQVPFKGSACHEAHCHSGVHKGLLGCSLWFGWLTHNHSLGACLIDFLLFNCGHFLSWWDLDCYQFWARLNKEVKGERRETYFHTFYLFYWECQ